MLPTQYMLLPLENYLRSNSKAIFSASSKLAPVLFEPAILLKESFLRFIGRFTSPDIDWIQTIHTGIGGMTPLPSQRPRIDVLTTSYYFRKKNLQATLRTNDKNEPKRTNERTSDNCLQYKPRSATPPGIRHAPPPIPVRARYNTSAYHRHVHDGIGAPPSTCIYVHKYEST